VSGGKTSKSDGVLTSWRTAFFDVRLALEHHLNLLVKEGMITAEEARLASNEQA